MKAAGRKGVVFPALINDTNVAMRSGFVVRDDPVRFSNFKCMQF